MKKITVCTAILMAIFTNAQSWSLTGNTGIDPFSNFLGTIDSKDLSLKTNNVERMRINSMGKIGIGTAPVSNLTLKLLGNTEFIANDKEKDGFHFFSEANVLNNGLDLMWLKFNNYQTNDVGLLTLSTPLTPGDWAKPVFTVRNNGKVLIGLSWNNNVSGCTDCNNYKLFVKDGIKTEKVKVEIAADNGWADYVFDKEYQLMDLKELESYIKENKHLPEVPTTKEAIKNGIELKEMNILLLKKIEELTLHIIDLNKKVENLQNSK
ncbi:hypothetical protein CLU96_2666 [Chryseobacterium sp. 52]|uniref:hypothetical protein n=1 Tax=Chryseobacterium sp. 52 TaxID=2035213 RepID=UPI000C196D5A|nr:hypothetical protein [Chryseobacterium sp. 52]PIF45657.1 hypothetical protein CLU96_2666 [Chryseobacterium sp. 52]